MNEIKKTNTIPINSEPNGQSSTSNTMTTETTFNNVFISPENDKFSEKDIKHCLICGKLIEKIKEEIKIEKGKKEEEGKKEKEKEKEIQFKDKDIQNAFIFNNKLCSRCRGPFQHKKEKLEKLSIPILVSLILQASLKHFDVNNMVNQALYGTPFSLKSTIISNVRSPYIFSPVSSQHLIVNEDNSFIINSKKIVNSKNSICKMLNRRIHEYSQKSLFNFGAMQRKAIQLTPSGRKPRTGPLGSYEDMIVQALISIGDINGSKPKDIFDWMEQNCIGIPEAFRASASQALKKASHKGKIKKIGNGLYKINPEYVRNKMDKKKKKNDKIEEPLVVNVKSVNKSKKKNTAKTKSKEEKDKENINLYNVKNNKYITPNVSPAQVTTKLSNDPIKKKSTQAVILSPPDVVMETTNSSEINQNTINTSKISGGISTSIPTDLSSTTTPKAFDHIASGKGYFDQLSPSVSPEMIESPSIVNNSISQYDNSLNHPVFLMNSIKESSKMKTNQTTPTINDKASDLLLYNPSNLVLTSNKKNDINSLAKFRLPNGINDINMTPIDYSNNKTKNLYNQIIQENPESLSQNIIGNSTADELNLMPSDLLYDSTIPNSGVEEPLNQTNGETSQFENSSVDHQLFSPPENDLSLLSSYYMDPRLQYLLSSSTNLSSNTLDILRDNNLTNTINPITNTLTSFPESPSSSSNPNSNTLNNSFNYSIFNDLLWQK